MTELIKNILIVGAGSFIGGSVRYLVSFLLKGSNSSFPYATLIVNLLGCFAIGLLCGYLIKTNSGQNFISTFFVYGVCGGFTTFSTFSKETFLMIQCGNYFNAFTYVAISILVGLLLTACGYMLTK
ncbi:MAG: fluoride efflux transporter CrcB [Bacteroidales bacterium]|nr:fluoride efflux transporter CrcB [Bacteroidales bacterium]